MGHQKLISILGTVLIICAIGELPGLESKPVGTDVNRGVAVTHNEGAPADSGNAAVAVPINADSEVVATNAESVAKVTNAEAVAEPTNAHVTNTEVAESIQAEAVAEPTNAHVTNTEVAELIQAEAVAEPTNAHVTNTEVAELIQAEAVAEPTNAHVTNTEVAELIQAEAVAEPTNAHVTNTEVAVPINAEALAEPTNAEDVAEPTSAEVAKHINAEAIAEGTETEHKITADEVEDKSELKLTLDTASMTLTSQGKRSPSKIAENHLDSQPAEELPSKISGRSFNANAKAALDALGEKDLARLNKIVSPHLNGTEGIHEAITAIKDVDQEEMDSLWDQIKATADLHHIQHCPGMEKVKLGSANAYHEMKKANKLKQDMHVVVETASKSLHSMSDCMKRFFTEMQAAVSITGKKTVQKYKLRKQKKKTRPVA